MQRRGEEIVFSATDLNNSLACDHLITLDLAALRGGEARPKVVSGQAEILSRLGEEHEANYLRYLIDERKLTVETIDRNLDVATAAAATEAAMARGKHVIYQATFFDGIWMGRADFLRRRDGGGGRWPWHYEVEDTKLARTTQPYFLLQLCYYTEHVARVQGFQPEWMYVVLGDGRPEAFRVDSFAAYYRSVKARFIERLSADPTTYPDPNLHCALCVWNPKCEAQRTADDHLSGVANITRLQTKRLNEAGIDTLRQLAAASPNTPPDDIKEPVYQRLQRQARLQYEQRQLKAAGDPNPYRYELLEGGVEPQRGFSLLPPPSPGDVFFDMEGDPYCEIGTGLEYLFGAYTADDNRFIPFWGCDRSDHPVNDRLAERRAFEAFIDFVMERRARHPDMHVYHYASYEKTALQKLSQRHGTREAEVVAILREDVLVDLYTVVRQALMVGQSGYSIKKIEEFYNKRGGESGIAGGGDSILVFEEWLALRADPARRDDAVLDDLAAYNHDDCFSTYGLREWLLRLRAEAESHFAVALPWFAGKVKAGAEKSTTPKHDDLMRRLDASIPDDYDPENPRDPRQGDLRPRYLVRHMLEYHWREDQPVWWQFHDRCESYVDDPDNLLDDSESIVGLTPVGDPEPIRKSHRQRMRFPLQFHKLDVGTKCFDALTKEPAGTIVAIDDEGDDEMGELVLERGPSLFNEPLPRAIVGCSVVPAGSVLDAIARFGEALLADGPTMRYRAAYDVLTGARPRLRGAAPDAVLQPEHPNAASVGPVVDALDESYLFVQGPPGSGKTTAAADLIVNLLERKLKVGITANSHAVVHNLLAAVESAARDRSVRIAGLKRCTEDREDTYYHSPRFENATGKFELSGYNLVGGTAWALGVPALDQQLDYLFIDEAGQVALPVAIAMMTCARNVVLLGDPQQLSQVRHATHPGDVGTSVLDHLLPDDRATVAPDRGILLSESYRMHPDVCCFISETMYDGKLQPAEGRERQRVDSPGLSGTGLRFLPVSHAGRRQESEEEARAIADSVEALLHGTFTDVEGAVHALRPSDVIVVSPYNAQVRCIRRELDRRGLQDVPVGTVDKFQGRQAYVVFYSTAASSPADAPRGARFIFDRQRFNVAISRARAIAVLVGSPALLELECSSIEDVRIANGVARFLELATVTTPPQPVAP